MKTDRVDPISPTGTKRLGFLSFTAEDAEIKNIENTKKWTSVRSVEN